MQPVSSVPPTAYQQPRTLARQSPVVLPNFHGLGHMLSGNVQTSDAFYPPRPIPLFIRGFHHLLSILICRPLGFRTDIDNLDRLKALKNKPNGMVLALNHSSLADSVSLQMLGKQAALTPVTLASLSMFGGPLFHPPLKVIWPIASRLGLCSLNEANPTVARSKAFARKTLEQRKYPLAIFPEGRVNWNSTRIAPCRTGAMEFASQAATTSQQRVNVVPIGITYTYSPKAKKQAGKRLLQLERKARALSRQKNKGQEKTPPALKDLPDNPSSQQRIDRLMDWVLTREEQELDVKPGSGQASNRSRSERIEAIRNQKLARLIGKYPIPQLTPVQQEIPKLYKAINDRQIRNQKPAPWVMLNPWASKRKAYLAKFKELQADMRQLKMLEILQSCQEAESLASSLHGDITRQMEAMNRLQCLVTGKRPGTLTVMRNCTAHIHIGNHITVNPLSNLSEAQQKAHILTLTQTLQTNLQASVNQAQKMTARTVARV